MIKVYKKLIILPFLAIYLNAEDSRLAMISEYKTMFSKIGEKREGVSSRIIDSVKTPFVQKKKSKQQVVNGKVVKPALELVLQAVINKKVKINGNWYSLYEKVGDLKIVRIKDSVVWLKNSEFRTKLKMRRENAKISIK